MTATVSALGGTTLSAGLADSQAQLNQAMGVGAGFGADSLTQFADAYRASGGGPTLAFLGLNPFQIVATGAFQGLFWSIIVIFLGIMTIVAMQHALRGRYALSAQHPLVLLSQVYFRLIIGVLLIANTPLVYAVLMTLNSVLSLGVQSMASQSMSALFQTGSMGTLTFAQARIEAVRNAAARRAVALYPGGGSRNEMIQIGTWYDAMASAINAGLASQGLGGQLPVLNAQVWSNAATPDDQVAAYVGRNVIQNFSQMVADLGALPAGSGPLSIAFPAGGSSQHAFEQRAVRSRPPALREERDGRCPQLSRHPDPSNCQRLSHAFPAGPGLVLREGRACRRGRRRIHDRMAGGGGLDRARHRGRPHAHGGVFLHGGDRSVD